MSDKTNLPYQIVFYCFQGVYYSINTYASHLVSSVDSLTGS